MRLKEHLLNGLLAALVVTSVALSSLVWFPSEAGRDQSTATSGAQVQPPPPPAMTRSMPEIFRPERILVRRTDGQVALLQAGSSAHAQLWAVAETVLSHVHPTSVSATTEDPTKGEGQQEWVTLYLPVPLRLADWGEQWSWSTLGSTNQSVAIDRVTFVLGKEPAVYLAGPTGGTYRLASFSEVEQKQLQDFVAKQVEAREFFKPRKLSLKDLPAPVLPDLLVPDIQWMPDARVRVQQPSEDTEKARFFPDLSVVRVIDEQEARSFTDGQRLLRITSSGVLEFRTTGSQGVALELRRALTLAKDWVDRHGGWSQDLVMTQYLQEPGRTRIRFDSRRSGPYPVESSMGAMSIDFVGDRVTYLRRDPDFVEVVFGRLQVPIISPEEAVKLAVENAPLSFFDLVRDVHPAYRIRPRQGATEPEWLLEPMWVVQVGASRLYVPATKSLDKRPVIQGP